MGVSQVTGASLILDGLLAMAIRIADHWRCSRSLRRLSGGRCGWKDAWATVVVECFFRPFHFLSSRSQHERNADTHSPKSAGRSFMTSVIFSRWTTPTETFHPDELTSPPTIWAMLNTICHLLSQLSTMSRRRVLWDQSRIPSSQSPQFDGVSNKKLICAKCDIMNQGIANRDLGHNDSLKNNRHDSHLNKHKCFRSRLDKCEPYYFAIAILRSFWDQAQVVSFASDGYKRFRLSPNMWIFLTFVLIRPKQI